LDRNWNYWKAGNDSLHELSFCAHSGRLPWAERKLPSTASKLFQSCKAIGFFVSLLWIFNHVLRFHRPKKIEGMHEVAALDKRLFAPIQS
jgi:hypothetical protein